jgi:hypothetical protein
LKDLPDEEKHIFFQNSCQAVHVTRLKIWEDKTKHSFVGLHAVFLAP